ncbi:MAG: hypothetical protein L3K26_05250, partial [Candidatus Hydrogenedentes bacterium]|nr:hypothetical protein [Candidatus Hydrogenedentota bacterium]
SAMPPLLTVYGVLGLAVQLLAGLLTAAIMMLRAMAPTLLDPMASTDLHGLAAFRELIPGLSVLMILIATYSILRSIALRSSVTISWPREAWWIVLALFFPITVGLFWLDGTVLSYAQPYYVWGTPLVTFAALFAFGLRKELLSLADVVVGLAVFLVIYAICGYTYVFPTEDTHYFINQHFGHWCVLLVSPIVWYPFVIDNQRHETPRWRV